MWFTFIMFFAITFYAAIESIEERGGFERLKAQYHKLANPGKDPEAEDMEVPVKEVSKETLDKVIEYMKEIVGKEELKIESPLTKPLDEILANTWYLTYVQGLSDDMLLQVLSAANHMDINSLMRLCAACAADKVQKMTLQQCRDFFGF